MSEHHDPNDHKEETQLNNDEMSQLRLLIGNADDGGFHLDDILAEYSSDLLCDDKETGADLPWPEPTHIPVSDVDNVVPFPGTKLREEDEEDDEDEDEEGDSEEEEDPASEEDSEEAEEEEEETSNVLRFPTQPEPGIKGLIDRLMEKGDAFASKMFVDKVDTPEARRLEKLIPGTDREEPDAPPARTSRLRVRIPHLPDLPRHEDCPPYELFRAVSKEKKDLRGRSLLVVLLTLLAAVQLMLPLSLLGEMGPLGHPRVQVLISLLLLCAGLYLARDVLLDSWKQVRGGFLDATFMTGLAGLCTLLDGLVLMAVPGPVTRMPFSVVVLAGLYFILHGAYHRRLAVRLSCRTAAASSEPFRVTLDARKWNGQDTYSKWSGDQTQFSAQMQTMDGAQQIFCRLCPFLLAADLVIALLNTAVTKNPAQLFWAMSAMLISTSAFGSALVYARPFHKIAIRLAKCGAALAGWPGVENADKGNRVLLTDNDLFPTGYITMNGYKVLHGFAAERVLAYTAALIRDSGSGLLKPFHDQLRAVGGRFYNADHLWFYEGGGMSANIRGDRVLVGCADFMTLQEVELPEDLNVSDAVFCAINGDLAGIFALSYSLPEAVFPSVEMLLENRVNPVLATRDFNIIPGMLQRRFHLEADQMDFPPVARRRELSDNEQGHSAALTGLLYREGLTPFAETISAAKRLRRATLVGALLCCIASGLGLVLTAYLTSVSAFSSLSPLSLLVYMLLWLAPVWFLSSWAHRY